MENITAVEALKMLMEDAYGWSDKVPDTKEWVVGLHETISKALEVKQKTDEECAVSFLMDESVYMQRFMGNLMQAMMTDQYEFIKNIYKSMTEDEMKQFIRISLDKMEKNLTEKCIKEGDDK